MLTLSQRSASSSEVKELGIIISCTKASYIDSQTQTNTKPMTLFPNY